MRRWTIVLLIVVAVILVIFGGAVQLISTFLPQETQESYVVYILGFGITYALVNGIVTAMQWFGKSPLDFLPEKTLREKDPQRFRLTKTTDVDFLYKKARDAEDSKEYEWAIAFAEVIVRLKPSETRAFRIIGESLLKMHRPNEALKYGEILVDKQPLSHDGYQLLGDAYFELSDLQEACKYYEMALERATPSFRQFILSDLSKTYEVLGMPQKAADAYQQYLELSDRDPLSDYHAANLERLKRLQNQATASKQE